MGLNTIKIGPNGTSALGIPTFTVAGLPTGAVGDLAFATNGLNASETTGNGTGVLVFFSGTTWKRVDTGATVGA